MPLSKPPGSYDGSPNRHLLRRGTCLWRVHTRRYPASGFNSSLADTLYGGARFDATAADPYPYYYAGLSEETALAETLLRDLLPDEHGYRPVPHAAVAGRRLSGLTLTQDLDMVSLVDAEDLAAIGQDAWLVTAQGRDYPQTRDWTRWLRGQAAWAHGLVWDSLRGRGSLAVVLFGDRLAVSFGTDYEKTLLHEVAELAIDLDDVPGLTWLNERLRCFRATILLS
jgi:hypothetical protein